MAVHDWNAPPYIIIQKQFWKCPTHVLTGLHFALIGFILGVLFSVWAFPANAGSLKDTLCQLRGDNARMVMEHRQNGRNKYTLVRLANRNAGIDRRELRAFRAAIEDAYDTPVGRTTFDRREITEDFTETVYRACMRNN